MKKIENSKGMALVSVLFIIVIFSILGLTLFNLTVSSSKQISKTEQDMQAVDIAEMGIIRYKNQIILHISNLLTDNIKDAILSIEQKNSTSLKNNPIQINGSTILLEMQSKGSMASIEDFLLDISPSEKFSASLDNTMYYTLEELTPINVNYPYEIQLHFNSIGTTLNNSSNINGIITINIEKLIDDSLTPGTPGDSGLDFSITKPSVTIETPNTTKSCNSNNKLENSCKYNNDISISTNNYNQSNIHAIINGKLEMTGPNTSISDSHLLITKDIIFKGTEGINNSKIFSEQSGEFGNVGNGLINSTLYFGKDVSFGQMNGSGKIHNSIIFTNNKTTFKNISGGIKKSTIYSGNDIEFGNLNSSIEDTLIYANADANFKNGNNGFLNSTLYVENNLSFKQINGEIKDSKIITNGLAKFDNLNQPFTNSTFYFNNATMGHINTSITNTKIYVLKDITTDNVNGNISNDSLICVGGTIHGGLAKKENGINIISKAKYPDAYQQKCSPTSSGGTPPSLDDLFPALPKMIDDTKVDYN